MKYGDENFFPNMRLALQILLTIAVSNKLKFILSYLRASMGQSRLLSIEREMTEEIDFDNIIKQFASAKARKINLQRSGDRFNLCDFFTLF